MLTCPGSEVFKLYAYTKGGGPIGWGKNLFYNKLQISTVHLLVKKKYKFDDQTLPRLSFAYIYRVFVNEIENRRTQHYLFGSLDFMTFAAINETMLPGKTTIIIYQSTKTSAVRFILWNMLIKQIRYGKK